MNKLLTVLIAGLFSAGVYAQATPATPAAKPMPTGKHATKKAAPHKKHAKQTHKKVQKAAS